MFATSSKLSKVRKISILCGLFFLFACAWGNPLPNVSKLEVSHQARSLQPGEVVLINVRTPIPLEHIKGQAFGKRFYLYLTDEVGVWRGLLGIDLETAPGLYQVELLGRGPKGQTLSNSHELVIVGKRFPTRRLTVAEKFVNPPPEMLKRIARESKMTSDIFRRVSPEKLWNGPFFAPVPGTPSSSFGKRSILNDKPRSPHSGTDFRANKGVPVKAPNLGRVVLATDLYYSGNTVILDHGLGLYSYFAHLSRITVREGELVSLGDVIGHVGATGRVTGPHLHWSVRLSLARVDPLSLMEVLSSSALE